MHIPTPLDGMFVKQDKPNDKTNDPNQPTFKLASAAKKMLGRAFMESDSDQPHIPVVQAALRVKATPLSMADFLVCLSTVHVTFVTAFAIGCGSTMLRFPHPRHSIPTSSAGTRSA